MTTSDYKCPYCKSENIDWTDQPIHGTNLYRAWCEDCQEEFKVQQFHDEE